MILINHGDCMDAMREMKDQSIDVAVVDPPYGLKMSTNAWSNNIKPCREWKGRRDTNNYTPKDWDNEKPSQDYFDELRRVSKYQIIWGGNHFADMLPASAGWLVWNKMVSMPTLSKCELAWTNIIGRVEIVSLLWSGFKKCEQVHRIHPTQKPVALYEWVYSNFCEPEWTILDTHVGSGSSAIAAHNMGRKYIGWEIDDEFHHKANRRLREHQRQLQLFQPSRDFQALV